MNAEQQHQQRRHQRSAANAGEADERADRKAGRGVEGMDEVQKARQIAALPGTPDFRSNAVHLFRGPTARRSRSQDRETSRAPPARNAMSLGLRFVKETIDARERILGACHGLGRIENDREDVL